MDAIALAKSLDASKDPHGVISLYELQRQLERRGLHELARAVRCLTEFVVPGRLSVSETAPWF